MTRIVSAIWGVRSTPMDSDHAWFELESAWDPAVPEDRPRRLRPLHLKPLNVRKPLPDFVVLGNRNLVVREQVAHALIAAGLRGVAFDRVYFVKRVRRTDGCRIRQAVESPMVEIVLDDVDPDFARCTTRVEIVDGQPKPIFEGHEEVHSRYDQASKELIRTRVPRQPGRGRVFLQNAVGDRDVFREGFTGLVRCTDRFKRTVEELGLIGLEFVEMGDIISEEGEAASQKSA